MSNAEFSVGFLGVGLMGAPMARRLLRAGIRVQAWNRTRTKANELKADGAVISETPQLAVAGTDFVCLCLTDSSAVESIMFSDHQVMRAVRKKATIIDFSTIGPQITRQFAEEAKHIANAIWLDCPVSGGVEAAKNGTLTIFAGGNGADIDRALPILNEVAANITHIGAVGGGQSAKLCNQLIVSANLIAIAEATHLAQALGLDASLLASALFGGFADSRPLQLFGARMAAAKDPGPKVAEVATMAKDVEMVLSAAKECGFKAPIIETIHTLYGELIENGYGNEDLPALMRIYRNR